MAYNININIFISGTSTDQLTDGLQHQHQHIRYLNSISLLMAYNININIFGTSTVSAYRRLTTSTSTSTSASVWNQHIRYFNSISIPMAYNINISISVNIYIFGTSTASAYRRLTTSTYSVLQQHQLTDGLQHQHQHIWHFNSISLPMAYNINIYISGTSTASAYWWPTTSTYLGLQKHQLTDGIQHQLFSWDSNQLWKIPEKEYFWLCGIGIPYSPHSGRTTKNLKCLILTLLPASLLWRFMRALMSPFFRSRRRSPASRNLRANFNPNFKLSLKIHL